MLYCPYRFCLIWRKGVLMAVLIVILIFVAIFAVYATVATNVLTVRKDTVSFSALPESANGLKIVLISDLHDRDMNRRLANKIKEQKPDMIVVCGDVHNRERKRAGKYQSR